MKKILTCALIAAISLSVFSCGKKNISNQEVKKENLSDLPSWVLDPKLEDGIAAVGIASPSKGGIKFQIPAAELDAKANIAATIQSEISRVTKDSLRSANVNNADDVEQFFAQATKEVVKNLPLSGVKRVNIHQAKDGTLYVHMVLTNEDYSNFLKNSEKSFMNQLKKAEIGRANINKTEEAAKALFDELEKERAAKKE
jgi:hypothetical protein